ncbi:MAG TPA: alpha-glucosidase family protein [Stellaceae bacterium]|nr:alpha-glucosidase family protein [Stellaceae bacterium]
MYDCDWWRGAVIYEIYPASFRDANGDGWGDLPGIVEKLDYIASLGVDAVWIAPFFRSPMQDFGYDVADACEVDPQFGTLADFDRVVAKAHDLGLRVIIDQVWGHTSQAHAWFETSRRSRVNERANWYVWADPKPDGTPPNNWLSVFGGPAWTWEPRRRQYYLHHFLAAQPTLNLRNPDVVEALLTVARFWLARGVDGFRLDAVDFLLHDPQLRDNPARPPASGQIPAKLFGLQHHCHDMLQPDVVDVLRRLRALADRFPGTALLGEVSSQDGAFERIAHYTKADEGLHMAYTLRPLRKDTFAHALGEALDEIAAAAGSGWLCWAFSNHDVERVASRWNPLKEHGLPPPDGFVEMLMAVLLSLRGSISLYQGEELGLEEAELDLGELRDPFGIAYFPEFAGRDGSRTPMPWRADAPHAGFSTATPWLPVPRAHFGTSVAEEEAAAAAPLHAWRRLIEWRKAHPALGVGSFRRLDAPHPLLVFERRLGGDRVVAVFNPSPQPQLVELGPDNTSFLASAGTRLEKGAGRLPPWGYCFAAMPAHEPAKAPVG